MINLKTTALAVIIFSTGAVFAGSMGPVCAPGNVSVPCAATAWDFGAQALYLRPSYNNSNAWAGIKETDVSDINQNETTIASIIDNKLDWSWAFKLEASYHLNTGNDINLNWYHLGSKTTSFSSTQTTTNGFFPVQDSYTTTTFSTKPSWDAVNLEFGQQVHFGERKKIRFHGGVQYARINTQLPSTNTTLNPNPNPPQPSTTIINSTGKLSYNGFGPRIGADMLYALTTDLSMYANGASAILTGSSNNIINSQSTLEGTTTTHKNGSVSANKTVLVPEIEAKLGLKYKHPLTRGDLTLDVGYMWVNYFNAQQNSLGSLVGTPSSAVATTIAYPDSNFSVQGPYVGLKWLG